MDFIRIIILYKTKQKMEKKMEQMIEIYEDLNKKFCRKEAQSIYQMILDTLKNLEPENRMEVLKQLVENNDALGFLNKFNKWGPKWMQHNWQTWQSDVERELNNVIGDAFCDLEDAYQCAYETTLEDLGEDRYDEDDEEYSYEEWMDDDYDEERADCCINNWNEFIGDDLKEYYFETIEYLEDLGPEGIEFLFENILNPYKNWF
jgi:hypothetical protein